MLWIYIHPKSEVSGHPGSKSTFWIHAKLCLQAVLKGYYIMSFKRNLKIGPDQKQISTVVLNCFFGWVHRSRDCCEGWAYIPHTSNSIFNSCGTSIGQLPMATKICKAVSIPQSTNPEELCYQIFFICLVKDELKQLRNLRGILTCIAGCLNQYIQSYHII